MSRLSGSICLLLSAAAYISGCRKHVPAPLYTSQLHPTEKGTEVRVMVTDSGRIALTLTAGELEFAGEEREEKIITARGGFIVQVYNPRGEPISAIQAEEGTVIPSEEKLWAQGKVIVSSPDGDTLMADELVWDRRKDIIFTESNVTFKTGSEVIEGRGFVSRSDLSEWEVKQVRAVVSPPVPLPPNN